MKILTILFFLPSVVSSMFIGAATSSLQIEGHNKGITIWDEFVYDYHYHPVENASNHFLQYEEDFELLRQMGSNNYRFSISWSRIMPYRWMEIDRDGIQFYHNLIDSLLAKNITPYATLYHWELPHYLNTPEINGWLDEKIVDYFFDYSLLMFEEYGDKVKYWMTINEPLTTSLQGYGETCSFAPLKCSLENQYLSGHYQLLAHAKVGHYYLNNYNGDIGLVINSNWFEPTNTNAIPNSVAMMDKTLGWFLNPILFGSYPSILKDMTLPFSEEETIQLLNSYSFIGINHYTSYYINDKNEISFDKNWLQSKANWLYVTPFGARKLFQYIHDYYTSTIPIYITECGMPQVQDPILDLDRVYYLSSYLYSIDSLNYDNIKGFFVWSLLDNFEWTQGYNESFGIIHVNYDNFIRTPKLSYYFLKDYIQMKNEIF